MRPILSALTAVAWVVVPLSLSIVACAPANREASVPVTASAAQPSAVPSATPPNTTPTIPSPPPTPASASDVLTQGRAPFDACYALARKAHPDLRRTSVEITFTMDDDGKLLNVDVVYRNRMDDAAKDCMRAAAEALKFPPSLHGKQTGTIVFTPP